MCSTCPAPVIARRNELLSIRSPMAISAAPVCFSSSPASGRRTKARTIPPFLAIDATTRWPVLPDAPVTKIGFVSSILRLRRPCRIPVAHLRGCDAMPLLLHRRNCRTLSPARIMASRRQRLTNWSASTCFCASYLQPPSPFACVAFGAEAQHVAVTDGQDHRPLRRRRQFGRDGAGRRATPYGDISARRSSSRTVLAPTARWRPTRSRARQPTATRCCGR